MKSKNKWKTASAFFFLVLFFVSRAKCSKCMYNNIINVDSFSLRPSMRTKRLHERDNMNIKLNNDNRFYFVPTQYFLCYFRLIFNFFFKRAKQRSLQKSCKNRNMFWHWVHWLIIIIYALRFVDCTLSCRLLTIVYFA